MRKQFIYIAISLFFSTHCISQIPQDGLVGYYPFNGDANDESNSGNNGTVYGASLDKDRFGNADRAYFFNGIDDYILISGAKYLNTNNFSYSIWVKASDLPLNRNAYNILEAGTYTNNFYGLVFSINNNYLNTTGFRVTNGNSDSTFVGSQTGQLPSPGLWYNVVVTRDKDSLLMYINTKKMIGINISGQYPYYNDTAISVYIGTRNQLFQFFHGHLDDLRIYNRSISPEEVKMLYEACTVYDANNEEIYLKADFTYDRIPCTKQIKFINLSSDTLNSFWSFGDGAISNENNPSHTYKIDKAYSVTLISRSLSACSDTAEKTILFEDDALVDRLFIPNVFTPNGDGTNDSFEIFEINNPCANPGRLTIFNRWGKKVFETEGKGLKWDGKSNLRAMSNGVYFYVLEGEGFKKSGYVSLLR